MTEIALGIIVWLVAIALATYVWTLLCRRGERRARRTERRGGYVHR
jgi:hypothetical protein